MSTVFTASENFPIWTSQQEPDDNFWRKFQHFANHEGEIVSKNIACPSKTMTRTDVIMRKSEMRTQ
ncbi:MAG: hypothetical protein AAFO91_03925 [Bacteroidota bacterium]